MQRYLTSDLTLTEVGEEFGTGRYNLALWLKRAQSMSTLGKGLESPAVSTGERRASDKLRLLIEASGLPRKELEEFRVREGLRDGDLERFRAEALRGLDGNLRSPQSTSHL